MTEEKKQELDKTSKEPARDDKGRLLPGQESLNPDGRPKGSLSITSWIKKHLEKNPEEFEEICKFYLQNRKMRDLLWKMLDGMPKQGVSLGVDDSVEEVSITIKGKKDEAKHTGDGSVGTELGGTSEGNEDRN